MEPVLSRRRWIAAAFVALLALAGGALALWYHLTPMPSPQVDPAMRDTVAAQVYSAAAPRPGEDVASLSARILKIAASPDSTWVCVGNWPAERAFGKRYWRQEYAFNDNSGLLVYSGGPADGVREFDGVLVFMREPLGN